MMRSLESLNDTAFYHDKYDPKAVLEQQYPEDKQEYQTVMRQEKTFMFDRSIQANGVKPFPKHLQVR
jgi:hypothetical protein